MSTVFATDEEALAKCPRDCKLTACKGKAIVWFLPYRRTSGAIEIPEKNQPLPVEAIIIHDNTGHGLAPGVMVGASRSHGQGFPYGEHGEHYLYLVPEKALILVNTEFSPEEPEFL